MQPNLVPWPRSIELEPAFFPLAGVKIEAAAPLTALGKIISAEILAATNGSLELPVTDSSSAVKQGVISMVLDPSANGEQSTLMVDRDKVLITGGNYNAIASATTTLLQALEFSSDADLIPATPSCVAAPAWRVPVMTVKDSPEVQFCFLKVDGYIHLNFCTLFLPLVCRLEEKTYTLINNPSLASAA